MVLPQLALVVGLTNQVVSQVKYLPSSFMNGDKMGKDTKAKKAFRTVNSILVGAVLGSVGVIVGSAIIFGVFIYPYLYLFTGFGHPDESNPLPWLAFAI